MLRRALFPWFAFLAGGWCAAHAQSVGPSRGALVVVGGGTLGREIVDRFIELAGGKDRAFVVIPTADGAESYAADYAGKTFLAKAGVRNITVLHTKEKAVADSEAFVQPIRQANAVWFPGGRQWRLVDSYLNTRVHRELFALLERGGVIGGSSAGATIQGSYLVRGAREGNAIMMAPGYEEGMAFLRGVAVDQHLLKRKRENDLVAVIERYPKLLGIGIDESTAIVVSGDQFDVIGSSKVAIYDGDDHGEGKRYYFLSPGDRFDLAARRRVPRQAEEPNSSRR
jgi:cyanophycinase